MFVLHNFACTYHIRDRKSDGLKCLGYVLCYLGLGMRYEAGICTIVISILL